MFPLIVALIMISIVISFVSLTLFFARKTFSPQTVSIPNFEIKDNSVFFKVKELGDTVYEIEKPKELTNNDKLSISYGYDKLIVANIREVFVNNVSV